MYSLAVFLYWRKDQDKYFKYCNTSCLPVFESLRWPVSVCYLISTGKQFRFVCKNPDVDKFPAVCTDLPFCSQTSKQHQFLFKCSLTMRTIFLFSSWEFLSFFYCQNSSSICSFLEMLLLTKWENKAKRSFTCKKIPSQTKNNFQPTIICFATCMDYMFFWTTLFLQKR